MLWRSISCQLILYDGSGNSNDNKGNGSSICGGNYSPESADPILNLFSDLYSELNVFLGKS